MKTPFATAFAPVLACVAASMLAMVGTPCIAQGTAPAAASNPGDTTVQRPAGGWTYSGVSDDPAKVSYAYPNNLIDRGGQRGRTLIEGRLKQRGTDRRTPTLVVNGNAMPLYSGEDGSYSRPYAFGPGSNGIEVRDAEGRTIKRVQFYEANRTKTTARVRIILAWDDPQAELDLHVITPDGGHAVWGDPIHATRGGLAVGGYHFDEKTRKRDVISARITLVFDENTPAERRETFSVPMRKIGDLTLVRSFMRG